MNQKRLNRLVLVIAVMAIISYFLHVILGILNYPGYNSLSQAVSDLTRDTAPSKGIARLFSNIYGVLSSLVAIGLMISFFKEKKRLLKLGIYLLSIMYLVSAIGYALFPLSSSTDMSDIQNVMHMVVTIVVVLLTITSLVILMIAFYRNHHFNFYSITLISFSLLMCGSVITGIVPKAYFGLAERISVYTVVLYLGFISYYSYNYHKNP
jgi:hypothetical membrane protein